MAATDILIAIEREDIDELDLVLEHSKAGINDRVRGLTPLWYAIMRDIVCVPMVEKLLNAGADPDCEARAGWSYHKADCPMQWLADNERRDLALLLMRHGADTGRLDREAQRFILGFDRDESDLAGVEQQVYLASRHRRFGERNPEELTDSFKTAMVRSGYDAWSTREHFGDPVKHFCSISDRKPEAVWCADRFGQTLNWLPDGRMILIAGEHEDSYDPDFRIYNDIIVISPSGSIAIYGYPEAVFPPTDFHTATLVGDFIFILGSLGYVDQRKGGVPVYRVNLSDYRIDQCMTSGDDPGRIYEHRTKLIGQDRIQVWGGKSTRNYQEQNPEILHELNLNSLRWTRVS